MGLGSFIGILIKFDSLGKNSVYNSSIWFLVSLRRKLPAAISKNYGKIVVKTWDSGWNEIIGPQGVKNEVLVLRTKFDVINHARFKLLIIICFLSFVLIFTLL